MDSLTKVENETVGTVISANRRYLLARPTGGFNDMLVQLEKVMRYAEVFDRDIIIDTSRSGLRAPLDRFFELPKADGIKVIIYNDQIGAELNALHSVYPSALRGRLTEYEVRWQKQHHMMAERESGVFVGFDVAKDHDAQLLVYEQAGGGRASFLALKRLKLNRDAAETIAKRLHKIGRGYDAIHIRHSDYKTQFRNLLVSLRPILYNRRVLLCSDSADAKSAAQRILHRSTTVLSASDIPDTGGRPLHMSGDLDSYDAGIDLLTDLLGLALSETLFFTKVSMSGKSLMTYSGYSLLAESLRRNPEVIAQLLQLADGAIVNELTSPVRPQDGANNLLQRLWRAQMTHLIRRRKVPDDWHDPDFRLSPEKVARYFDPSVFE